MCAYANLGGIQSCYLTAHYANAQKMLLGQISLATMTLPTVMQNALIWDCVIAEAVSVNASLGSLELLVSEWRVRWIVVAMASA